MFFFLERLKRHTAQAHRTSQDAFDLKSKAVIQNAYIKGLHSTPLASPRNMLRKFFIRDRYTEGHTALEGGVCCLCLMPAQVGGPLPYTVKVFIISQNEKVQGLLLWWLDHFKGPTLLSFSSPFLSPSVYGYLPHPLSPWVTDLWAASP